MNRQTLSKWKYSDKYREMASLCRCTDSSSLFEFSILIAKEF